MLRKFTKENSHKSSALTVAQKYRKKHTHIQAKLREKHRKTKILTQKVTKVVLKTNKSARKTHAKIIIKHIKILRKKRKCAKTLPKFQAFSYTFGTCIFLKISASLGIRPRVFLTSATRAARSTRKNKK
jgi:hypothetical protein